MATQDQAPRNEGEFVVNGCTIRSARRLAEYLQERQRRKPEYAELFPERVFHVIRPRYCEMLGINPEDMIALSLGDVWAEKLDAEVETNFRELPSTMPLADRIFEAHRKAFVGSEQVMAFVKLRFFAGCGGCPAHRNPVT